MAYQSQRKSKLSKLVKKGVSISLILSMFAGIEQAFAITLVNGETIVASSNQQVSMKDGTILHAGAGRLMLSKKIWRPLKKQAIQVFKHPQLML